MGSSEADKPAKESKTPATQVELYLMLSLAVTLCVVDEEIFRK